MANDNMRSEGFLAAQRLINEMVANRTVGTDYKRTASQGTSSSASGGTAQAQTNANTYVTKRLRQLGLDRSEVNDEYISSFLADAQKYANEGTSLNVRMGYNTSSSIYNSRSEAADDLRSRSWAISRYLEQNKDSVPEEYYTGMRDYLDNFDRYTTQSLYSLYRANEYYSQFESEDQARIAEMSADDVRAEIDRMASAEDDFGIVHGLLISNMPYNREYAQQDGRDMAVYDEVERNRQYISEKYGITFTEDYMANNEQLSALLTQLEEGNAGSSAVAYTTKDGQNVTWQMLYDSKFAAEDLEKRYGTYSRNADWAEMSQGIEFSEDTKSDYDIVFELSRSGMPYDRETAESSGVDMTEFDRIEAQRQYISQKYGVDLYSDIYNNVNIYNELMGQLENDPGQDGNFEHLSYLTDQEKEVLNYIYHTEGREAALVWHNSRMGLYEDRFNGVMVEQMANVGADNKFWGSAGALALEVASGFEYLGDIMTYAATGELGDNTSARAAAALQSGVMESVNWEIGNWDAFDFIYGAGMSGVSSATNMLLFGPMGGTMMGLGAAAQATNDALDRGMNTNQAFWTGVAAGVFEGLFESWSIGNFNALREVASANGWDIAMNIGKAMLVNASEETLTEIANITYDSIMNGDFSQYETLVRQYVVSGMSEQEAKWKAAIELGVQVVESGASGALMGFGFGVAGSSQAIAGNAVRSVGSAVQNNAMARGTINAEGGVDALMALAKEVAGVSSSDMQNRLNRHISNVENNASKRNVRNLYNSVNVANRELDKGDVSKSLIQNGISEDKANAIAEAIVASSNGKILTAKQQNLLNSYIGDSRVEQALEEAGAGTMARGLKMGLFQHGVKKGNLKGFADASRMMQELPGQEKASASDTVDGENKTGVEAAYEVSADGKTILKSTGETINVREVASTKDGQMTLMLDDGSTVDAQDVIFGSEGEALIYETVAQMGASVNAANILVNGFKAMQEDGLAARVYAQGVSEAFRYGKMGIPMRELANSSFASKLNVGQQEYVYRQGKRAAGKQVAREQAVVRSKQTGKKSAAPGKVHFDGNRSSLTDRQRVSLSTLETVAEVLGVQIYVFESPLVNGKRVGANGWYDQRNGSIHIDLHAGMTGEATMLFTAAHELVHFIKQWSPAKFKVLANFLMQEYGQKGISVEELVQKQITKAKKSGNRDISYEEAYEEVIADSMETMLADGKVVEKLAKLKQQDRTLWQKIKDFISDLADKIHAIYKGMTADSEEGRIVADMGKAVYRLQELFAEALYDASENFQSVEKNTTDDGGVSRDDAIKRSDRIVDQIQSALPKIMALDSVYTIDSSNAVPYTSDWKTDEQSGHAVFKAQGGVANRHGFGRIVLGKKGAVSTIFHGNGPAKQAAFPAIKAVIEQGIEIGSDSNHNGKGFDTVTFAAPVNFFGAKAPLGVVVKVSINGRGDKSFYIHEICDAEGNYIQLEDGVVSKKEISSTGLVDPSSTASAADDGISPKTNISNESEKVKKESLESLDIAIDSDTESVAPTLLFSERTWTESDYVQERTKAAKEIANAIGVSEKKARAYIDSVNSIAKMIAEDRVRLDYFSSPGRSSFVGNVEYGGSFDFSTLCKKRRLLTGTFTAIQKALPNTALTADEILDIRNRMKDAGLEVSCGLCYVEGSRANMGQFAKEFLKLYKKYYPDAWQPNMADVNTPDGIEWVRINHPECYEQYEYFWNHYGTMKPGDKNLFASQQKPKLYQLHTEYKGEILDKFKDDDNVEEKNLNGGIRLQSFSDFEIVHLIDTMQIIMDMSRVGLAGQAYTKVPDFAWALGDTGLKINLSLIAKGVDENGKLIFDDVEGMPIADAMRLRDRYSANVGTILVAFNDEQLMAAMADDRVDYIIPFHRSQWKKSQYGAMGLPAKTKDYTYMQNEKFIKPQYHEYRGRMVKDKATNYMPNEYWDFSKSGRENAEAYLEMCARNNKRPKFYKLLQNNGDGSYSLKADGSTDGYWKLLIDFKMYDNSDKGSPQMPVKPEFNMEEATRMLNDYSGGHSNFPVAQGIVDDFVKEYKDSHKGVKFSDRDSDGNQLSKTQQKFFKDSKVRDRNGNLLVMYHGTNADFTVFDKSKLYDGLGFFFTDDRWEAADYGTPRKCYLNISNPFDMTGDTLLEEFLGDEPKYKDGHFNSSAAVKGLIEAGYDGIYSYSKGATWYIAFDPEQIKSTGNKRPTANPDIRYSDRDTESVSDRSLLANAFESLAKNDIERNKIQEYKGKIDLINAEEQKLHRLNDKIKELSFAKGPKDTKKIRNLQFEARETANRISVYDKQLLRLEASKPLQDVLTREKEMVRKREQQRSKEAMEAYRERATKTQRELLDRWQESRKKGVENRQKTAMRHKIKGVVNDLNQYLLKGTKERHVPIGLQKAVAEALNAVNMDTVGAEERITKLQAEMMKAKTPDQIQEISRKIDHIQEMGDKMGDRLRKLKEAYDEFINSDDPLIANAHDDGLSAHMMTLIVRVGDTPLRDMSLSQLEDVYDVYKIVLATIRKANKSFADNKKREISVRANQAMAELDEVGGKRGKRIAALKKIEPFFWNNLKPVYAFEHIGSSALTEAFNNVRAGEDVWAKNVTEARAFYLDKAKKYQYDSWDFDKKYGFTSTSGLNFELTLDHIMSLYAYSKRAQADEHLEYGGFVFDPNTEVVEKTKSGIKVKYNVATATAYNLSKETVTDIVSKLTPEQKGYADEMQAYLSDVMGAKGNEVSLAMYDIKLFKEKHYFPLKSATQYMARAKEQAQGEVKVKNSGFSKNTMPHAKNPIVLSSFMDVWANHVNDMSMYHAFVLPMEDFYRIYNYTTPSNNPKMPVEGVNPYLENAFGSGATAYIDQLLKDLNGGARTDSTTGFINKAMGLFKKGAVFASASVVVQQPSAIARATALLDVKYFIGPKVDGKRHKQLWAEVKEYAPVAIIKEMGYFDTNMGKSTQDFILGKEYSTIKEKAKALVTDSNYRDEVLSKAPALADEIAWCSIWEAVKRETSANNPGMDAKSEEFLKKAGERFTEVIVKTQVYDSVLSRSANMRSKDTGMKMATAFMAEPTTSINMIADALLKGKRNGVEGRRYCRNAIGAVVASQILNSFLVAWVYAARDDDEDESFAEKWISQFVSGIWDGLNPLTYIPFIKDVVSIVKGYDVERSDMAVISDLWNAWKQLENEDVSVWRKIENFAGSIFQIFGLPVKNIMRDLRALYQAFDTIVNGENTTAAGIAYAVSGAITGTTVSNKDQLYDALVRGSESHAERVATRYEDEDAADAAVRSAIRERFLDGEIDALTARNHLITYAGMDVEEAHWLLDEWKHKLENGSDDEYNKYDRFYEAVQTGSNLRTVIQEYTENGVDQKTLRTQITEHFKPLYVEMSASERAGLKGYLINALELCGKKREDAVEILDSWDFEAKNGFAYSDRKSAYLNGDITAAQLRQVLIETGGYSEEDADAQIEAYDWEKQGYENVTAAAIRDYNEFCAEANVPKDIFLHIRQFSNNTENDVDEETGRTIYYSAMRKVMAEIDAQTGLTPAQKTAIARSLGWSEKNIDKYKLW